MDRLFLHIVHRPEMVPESAHKNGLKTAIQMTCASLFRDAAISLVKENREQYGDEMTSAGSSLRAVPAEIQDRRLLHLDVLYFLNE